jgi:peptidyl-tRNA hydrolase
MYLVVRSDRVVAPQEVYTAAARATMDCVARHYDRDPWHDAFRQWSEQSFRKVTLRARGSAWARLAGYDHGSDRLGDEALVRVLPPRRKSASDPLLRNLQVYNPDRATLPPDVWLDVPPDAMCFAVNPTIAMSIGKTAAQIAHAVLMCAWSPRTDTQARARWTAAGYPCAIVSGEAWTRLRTLPGAVVVRDAGLTEVAPGTETVVAVFPV